MMRVGDVYEYPSGACVKVVSVRGGLVALRRLDRQGDATGYGYAVTPDTLTRRATFAWHDEH